MRDMPSGEQQTLDSAGVDSGKIKGHAEGSKLNQQGAEGTRSIGPISTGCEPWRFFLLFFTT